MVHKMAAQKHNQPAERSTREDILPSSMHIIEQKSKDGKLHRSRSLIRVNLPV